MVSILKIITSVVENQEKDESLWQDQGDYAIDMTKLRKELMRLHSVIILSSELHDEMKKMEKKIEDAEMDEILRKKNEGLADLHQALKERTAEVIQLRVQLGRMLGKGGEDDEAETSGSERGELT